MAWAVARSMVCVVGWNASPRWASGFQPRDLQGPSEAVHQQPIPGGRIRSVGHGTTPCSTIACRRFHAGRPFAAAAEKNSTILRISA